MQKRVVGFILLLTVVLTCIPAAAATETSPLTLGKAVTGTRQENEDVWYSFKAENDGLYKVLNTSTTTSNYDYGGGNVQIYDRSGGTEFYLPDSGYTIQPYGFNSFQGAFVHEFAVYLHKGEYLFKETSGRGVNSYTLLVERIATPFGEDTEPNDSDAVAQAFALNGTVGGTVGGRRDDGSKDKNDYYAVNIPQIMTGRFFLEAERGHMRFYVYDQNGNALQGQSYDKQTKLNDLNGKYMLSEVFDFQEPGRYYIRLESQYTEGLSDCYTPYSLKMGDGSGTASLPAVSKASAESVETGIKIILPELTTGTGFSIYRSESVGNKGVLIAENVNARSFIDVNVEAAKTYHYTIDEVFADNSVKTVSGNISVTANDVIAGEAIDGQKGFILMKIGDPKMIVNGMESEIDPGRGTTPTAHNGRTLVPIRAIVEVMGGIVGWDQNAGMITLDVNGKQIVMWLGQKIIQVNGHSLEIDVPPAVMNERTMLPIRFVAENAGCAIEWIASTQEIVIVFSVL